MAEAKSWLAPLWGGLPLLLSPKGVACGAFPLSGKVAAPGMVWPYTRPLIRSLPL